jgi:hypothetical protein
MKTVKHTLRLPDSALNNSGHCTAMSALHCQRNRAPHSDPPAVVHKYFLLISSRKAHSICMQLGSHIILSSLAMYLYAILSNASLQW